ncbi:MAG: ABC transporter permease [Treponema sp.]|jgi:ribose/xylose/arabinose/galactoside ABC-type transport system permease subunit|nr:ABC transporter permease [Treponema sp.]
MKQELLQRAKTNEGILFIMFIVTFVLMSIFSPGRFLSKGNLQSMAYQLPEFGILSLSMMLVIVSGGINLSLTFTATLSMIVGCLLMSVITKNGGPPLVAIFSGVTLMFVVSFICGALNGLIVVYLGVVPMIATLASATLFEGISLNITRGGSVTGFPQEFLAIGGRQFLGIPVPMIVFVVIIIGMHLLLERSSFGIAILMIGSNPKVSWYSGIKVKKILFAVYIIAGILAAVAGVLMASRYNSAKESYGSSYLLQSIAAAVLGGTDINGGEGTILGTIIAVMIIQVISSGLNIFGINRYLTTVVMGGILLVVLTIKFFMNRTSR